MWKVSKRDMLELVLPWARGLLSEPMMKTDDRALSYVRYFVWAIPLAEAILVEARMRRDWPCECPVKKVSTVQALRRDTEDLAHLKECFGRLREPSEESGDKRRCAKCGESKTWHQLLAVVSDEHGDAMGAKRLLCYLEASTGANFPPYGPPKENDAFEAWVEGTSYKRHERRLAIVVQRCHHRMQRWRTPGGFLRLVTWVSWAIRQGSAESGGLAHFMGSVWKMDLAYHDRWEDPLNAVILKSTLVHTAQQQAAWRARWARIITGGGSGGGPIRRDSKRMARKLERRHKRSILQLALQANELRTSAEFPSSDLLLEEALGKEPPALGDEEAAYTQMQENCTVM